MEKMMQKLFPEICKKEAPPQQQQSNLNNNNNNNNNNIANTNILSFLKRSK